MSNRLRHEYFVLLILVSVLIGCNQNTSVMADLPQNSPTNNPTIVGDTNTDQEFLFTEADLENALVLNPTTSTTVNIKALNTIPDSSFSVLDLSGSEEPLNTQLTTTQLDGLVCNIAHDPAGTYKWGIYRHFLANTGVDTKGLFGVLDLGRRIQSAACRKDGKRAVFAMIHPGGADNEIFVIDEFGAPAFLTNDSYEQIDVTMNADGNIVAWNVQVNGKGLIVVWIWDASGGFTEIVHNGPVGFFEPSLSDNGEWLTFIDNQPTQTNVYLHKLADGTTSIVKTSPGRLSLRHPSVSDSGNTVGWMEGSAFMVKNVPSGAITQLVDDPNINHAQIASNNSAVYSTKDATHSGTKVINFADAQVRNVVIPVLLPQEYYGATWTPSPPVPPVLPPTLTVTAASTSVLETDGTVTLTVARSGDTTSAVTVNLASNDLSELTVPASVVIPAGSASATVSATILNDNLLDGDQAVVVTVSEAIHTSGTVNLTVVDVPPPTMTLAVAPTPVTEASGTVTLTATVSPAPTTALTVNIASAGDGSELTVPATLTIAAGATTGSVIVAVLDDNTADGDQVVNLTGTAPGYPNAPLAITVVDVPPVVGSLSIGVSPTPVTETSGTVTLTATVSPAPSAPVTVTVTSDGDGSELTVPATLTIAAGATTGTAIITVLNDNIADGDQVVNLTANAPGYPNTPPPLAVTVVDVPPAMPAITVSATPNPVNESAGTVALTVSVSPVPSAAMTVTLTGNGDGSELTLPATVTVPTTGIVTVNVPVLDEGTVDGNQTVTVTASATGATTGTAAIVVADTTVPPPAYVCQSNTALEASMVGGHLTIVDCAGYTDEQLTVAFFAASNLLLVNTNSKAWQVTAGGPALFANGSGSIGVPLNSVTALTVDTKPAANHTDTFTSVIDLTLSGGLDVTAHTVQLQQKLISTGAGLLTLNGFKTVATGPTGATLLTTTGAVNIFGNNDGMACRGVTGDFNGIDINAASITTVSGPITIAGCGGNAGTDIGVALGTSSVVESASGAIAISGKGGNSGTNNNAGVFINGSRIVSTGTAKISITGDGGSGGTTDNNGVTILNNIAGSYGSAGIYSVDGDIEILGQGGLNTTDKSNLGISVQGAAEIKSTGAAKINVTGNGGSGASCPATDPNPILNECSHNGINVLFNAQIVAAGTGDITLEGRGGTADGREHHGIVISTGVASLGGTSAKVMSTGPDIKLTGFGGNDTSNTKVAGSGIYLIHGGSVEAANGANIIMNGTAGKGLNEGNGIWLEGDFKNANGGLASLVSAQNGNITMIGTGNTAAGSQNNGIILLNGNVLTTGTGTISMTGNGGGPVQEARGVMLTTISSISTTSGKIEVTGNAGTGTGPASTGVAVSNESVITSNTGIITLSGTGGTGSNDNQGVIIGNTLASFVNATSQIVNLGPSKVQTTSGAINVTGQGGNANGTGNAGVQVGSGIGNAQIQSTSGPITVNGTGGTGSDTSIGVFVRDSGSLISSTSVSVTGTSGTVSTGTFNPAVYLIGGGNIVQNGVPATMPGGFLPLVAFPVPVGTSATVTF